MKKILKKIYNNNYLTYQESFYLFNNIMNERIHNIQLSAIISIMAARKETIEEIIGARDALFQYVPMFPKLNYMFADIVGTGGDKKNSFNISTVSAIVAACYGLKIAKICNVSSSGSLGSVELLTDLNINIFISPKKSKKLLDNNNICFLSANQYLHSFKKVAKIRKILQTKTIFNILGPFLNPTKPRYGIIGVHSPRLLLNFAKILQRLQYKHAMVIHSGGLDEVTLYDDVQIIELKNNKFFKYTLTPENFGLQKQKESCIINKNKKENYIETIKLFKGYGEKNYVNTIAANVALLLKIFKYKDLKKNTLNIIKLINSGKIYNFICKLSKLTTKKTK